MNDRITALEEALRPFADFADARGFDRLPDHLPMTQGSRFARRQVTAADFKAARAALAAIRAAPDCHQPDLVTANPAERAGWNAAIAWLETYLADYVSEHGIYDHSTGVTEFPDDGEWAGSVQEIIYGMRLAMPAALDLTPAPAVDPRTVIGGDVSVAVCPICDIAGCQHVRGEAPAVEPVALTYTNWRGQTAVRRIVPLRVWFGSTAWHPEPQWLLTAIDMDKGFERDFALAGFGQPVTAQDAARVPEIAAAFEAGAMAVHREWLRSHEHGEGPPRGEPDFSDAASDYAALRAIGGDA
ncbi:hypothetical protein GCM10007291_07560 [Gemmobacter nanjingensis]|uniref:Uncharacterized protein n=1 Tax=Gemmobacter nanjingensis TaxID=488454 RepID=A0ABQ3F876_9RHOB|nr:hypothetical protein [Gemmobacter nanjingensis]GHC12740.1 hypothetical protein GCM10007291_07560 [Gemmobacter nanjingensis]